MDANAEVMPAVSLSGAHPSGLQKPRDPRANDPNRHAAAAKPAPIQRTSEDPMRRTDRYRLVMPYSTRV